MRCPYCNAQLDDDEIFCANCGKKVPLPFCPNCGTQLERGMRFCPKCGTDLSEPRQQSRQTSQDSEPQQQSRQTPQDSDVQDRYDSYDDREDYDDGDDYDWDDENPNRRKWLPLIVVIVIAAVVVIVFAAWRFGMLDNVLGGRQREAVEETAEEEAEEEEEAEHVYYLTFATQVLDFDEPGLVSRVYFDTDIEDQSEITWTSSDPTVAKVDDNGYVTSVGAGRAVITAEWGDLSASCSVACDYGSDEEAADEAEESSGEDEHHLTFVTQVLNFDDAGLTSRIFFDTDIENQSEINWTSSDPSVATVDENGYVTSVGPGQTVVTAQWGNLSASCQVTCEFDLDEEEADNDASSADGYLCTYSSTRLITQADMTALSAGNYGALPAGKSLAQMIINEIYAKHGYLFQTQEIQDYFDQKTWYRNIGSYSSDANVIVSRMNDIEKQNIEFLNNY